VFNFNLDFRESMYIIMAAGGEYKNQVKIEPSHILVKCCI